MEPTLCPSESTDQHERKIGLEDKRTNVPEMEFVRSP